MVTLRLESYFTQIRRGKISNTLYMSYAQFVKEHYDRSLTFTANAKRLSAMWKKQKAKRGAGDNKFHVLLRPSFPNQLRIPQGGGLKMKKCTKGMDEASKRCRGEYVPEVFGRELQGGCHKKSGKGFLVGNMRREPTMAYPAVCGREWSNC